MIYYYHHHYCCYYYYYDDGDSEEEEEHEDIDAGHGFFQSHNDFHSCDIHLNWFICPVESIKK